MIIDAEVDRLFVISDLHLGNPASTAATRVLPFLDHVADQGASVCINGDGFDMLQTSFKRIVNSGVPLLDRLRLVTEGGGRVYYIVGNHDLALEHFFDSIVNFTMCPFLNVTSGDARIRIEHGHIYDPLFAKHPDLYETATRLAGLALFLRADVYQLWTRLADWADTRRRAKAGDDLTAASYCHGAAEMLLQRGFDAVLFGHTHNPEHVQMPSGTYVNSGNWLRGRTYIDIDHGKIDLKRWES